VPARNLICCVYSLFHSVAFHIPEDSTVHATAVKTSNSKYVTYYMTFIFFFFSELKKLSEESLTRQPEEVFDIICKLGEG
jgi:hypothetical protein